MTYIGSFPAGGSIPQNVKTISGSVSCGADAQKVTIENATSSTLVINGDFFISPQSVKTIPVNLTAGQFSWRTTSSCRVRTCRYEIDGDGQSFSGQGVYPISVGPLFAVWNATDPQASQRYQAEKLITAGAPGIFLPSLYPGGSGIQDCAISEMDVNLYTAITGGGPPYPIIASLDVDAGLNFQIDAWPGSATFQVSYSFGMGVQAIDLSGFGAAAGQAFLKFKLMGR